MGTLCVQLLLQFYADKDKDKEALFYVAFETDNISSVDH